MKRVLDILTEKLKELDVDPNVCAICGLSADNLALYVGLFCHIHGECIHKVGIDFTNPERDVHDQIVSEAELLLLNDDAEAPAVGQGAIPPLSFSDECDTSSSTPDEWNQNDDSPEVSTTCEDNEVPESVPKERLMKLAEPFIPYEDASLKILPHSSQFQVFKATRMRTRHSVRSRSEHLKPSSR